MTSIDRSIRQSWTLFVAVLLSVALAFFIFIDRQKQDADQQRNIKANQQLARCTAAAVNAQNARSTYLARYVQPLNVLRAELDLAHVNDEPESTIKALQARLGRAELTYDAAVKANPLPKLQKFGCTALIGPTPTLNPPTVPTPTPTLTIPSALRTPTASTHTTARTTPATTPARPTAATSTIRKRPTTTPTSRAAAAEPSTTASKPPATAPSSLTLCGVLHVLNLCEPGVT